MNHLQRLAASFSLEHGGGEIDHRPPETSQQTQSPREIRQQELDLLVPRQNRLHRELRERLEPRQNRQCESLRDEELGGLSGPRDGDGGHQYRRSRPQDCGRRHFGQRHGQKKQEKDW